MDKSYQITNRERRLDRIQQEKKYKEKEKLVYKVYEIVVSTADRSGSIIPKLCESAGTSQHRRTIVGHIAQLTCEQILEEAQQEKKEIDHVKRR